MKNNENYINAFNSNPTKAISIIEDAINCRLELTDEVKLEIIDTIYTQVTASETAKQMIAQEISNQFWKAKEMFGWTGETTMAQAQADLWGNAPEVIENNPL